MIEDCGRDKIVVEGGRGALSSRNTPLKRSELKSECWDMAHKRDMNHKSEE